MFTGLAFAAKIKHLEPDIGKFGRYNKDNVLHWHLQYKIRFFIIVRHPPVSLVGVILPEVLKFTAEK